MEINFDEQNAGEIYFNMTQTLVPRPIAWILTKNEVGGYNIAPFSYFTAICSDPPLILFSVGKKPDGTPKDTRANILRTGEFIVHIPGTISMEAVNESSATLPAEVSEVEKLGLETTAFGHFSLPRIAGCPVAYACELYEVKEIGPKKQALIFGKIKSLYIDEKIVSTDKKGRLKTDLKKLDPLSRLGADEYASLGEIFKISRPK
ncbi:MAG: flavin reductase family protein [Deltaproteobacteria bacterium]|nr:flavin reductase family protein [Deltaproteobacteria bacterium]